MTNLRLVASQQVLSPLALASFRLGSQKPALIGFVPAGSAGK
jgi:hypothetical protein